MKTAVLPLLILSLFLAPLACCPIKSTTTTQLVDYAAKETAKTTIQRDSIRVHSVDTVKIYEKGDTVFQYITRWRTEYRDKLLYDTLIVRDTIYVSRDVEVEAVKYKRNFIGVGIFAALFCFLMCVYFIKRR